MAVGAMIAIAVPGVAAPISNAAAKADERRAALDPLFRALAQARDARAAQTAAAALIEKFRTLPGPVIDLLLSRAQLAATRGGEAADGLQKARRFLDEAVAIDPDCAECWVEHAQLALLSDELGTALYDLNRGLTLEPRHFIAWNLLGNVLRSLNRDKEALEAFEKAVALHPFFEAAKQSAQQLRLVVRGRPA